MRTLLLAVAMAAAVATPALAHRGHAGLTVIEIDQRTGDVSVVHHFSAHDVEPALVSIAPQAQPSLDDPKALAALEAHVAQRFRVEIDGAATPLSRVDTRLAADNIRVVFAGHTDPADVQTVTVDLDFFPGVHDDQEQQVNVRTDGVTRSVIFRPGSQAQSVSFAR